MGYYTRYNLEIDPKPEKDLEDYIDNHDVLPWLIKCSDETKWYDHEADMVEVSSKFPQYLFTLDGQGEEQGDVWRKYFKGGLMQEWRLTPQTPDPFDPKKLKMVE